MMHAKVTRNVINILLVAVIFLVIFTGKDVIDQNILLEEKMVNYWNYLSPNNTSLLSVSSAIINNDVHGNVFLPYWTEPEESTISLFFDENDDSITINGIIDEGTNIATSYLSLPAGKYILSDSKNKESESFINKNIMVYIWSYNREKVIACTPNKTVFEINKDDRYNIGIRVSSNTIYKDEKIYPMIRIYSENSNYTYKPSELERVRICNISSNNSDIIISEKELEVFYRIYSHEDYPWVSIILNDGYGIQIIDDIKLYGQMDSVGRVIGEKILLKSDEEIMKLINNC